MVARLAGLTLVAGTLAVVGGAPAEALGVRGDVDSWAPTGTTNVAPTATVTADSEQSDYPATAVINGNDGTLPATPPMETDVWSNANVGPLGGWVKLAFPADVSGITRIVVFPRGDSWGYGVYFPAKYSVSLLDAEGAEVWSKTVVHPNPPGGAVVSGPDVLDLLAPATARTVRIDVLERHSRDGGVLQLAEVAVFAGASPVTESPNIAPFADVSYSTSRETTNGSHAAAFAHDGLAGNTMGWSSNDSSPTTSTTAWLAYDLGCAADVDKLVVYPRVEADNLFPKQYRLETSLDGSTWEPLTTVSGNGPSEETPQVFTPQSPVAARHVRLFVEARNAASQVQIAEFAVHGQYDGACVSQKKPALLMSPGDVEQSWFTSRGPVGGTGITFSSSDDEVATVSSEGRITAVAEGTATIEAVGDPASEAAGMRIEVQVQNDIPRVGEDILVGGFYSPRPEFTNDEQFATMAEFGLDMLMGVQHNDEIATLEGNYTNAMLAAEHGFMYMPSSEARLGCEPLRGRSPSDVRAILDDYRHVPAVAGFLLCDEGHPATAWSTAFNTIREDAPGLYPHYNFCFLGACGVDEEYMRSWLDATGGVRTDWTAPDYLMFDMYPLKGSIAFSSWFSNLENTRKLGLEYKIKTGTYLQSVGYGGSVPTRRPTSPEIVWEANTAMAYGYKQLTYFTYWQPSLDEYAAEVFTEGIIAADGTRSDRFDALKQLNSEIHALGPTLMGLDAQRVYFNGATNGQQPVPSEVAAPSPDGTLPAGAFFVHADGSQDLLFSHLVDRETGESYLFVVNNTFDGTDPAPTDATLRFAPMIESVTEVSRADGTESTVALDGHALSLSLAGAEGRLYRLNVVDTTDLQQAIDEAGELSAADYTTSSWAALGAVVTEAQEVLAAAEAGQAGQAAVGQAAAALGDAVRALIPRGDPRALEALITVAESFVPKLDDFTDDSAAALTDALTTAKAVYAERADRSQEQIDAAGSGLQSALVGLVVKPSTVEKAGLQYLYDAALAVPNRGRYTSRSWAILQAELDDAREVLDDPDATQVQVDTAVNELSRAISGLELKRPPR